jgi:hypothetical protein
MAAITDGSRTVANYIEAATPIADVPCRREQNSAGPEIVNDRNQIVLDRNKLSETVVEQHVELLDYSVRPVEGRCQVPPLPDRVFDKDEKVPLAETFENKRLGKALAVAKVMQDLALPPKVHTNGRKLGYQKRGRQIYGPDYMPKIPVKSVKEGPIPNLVELTG